MPIGGTVNGINLTAFSSSVASTLSNQSAATSSYAINSTIQGQLAGVVSSSTQVAPLLPGGTVTSSAQYPGWVTASSQIDYNSIQNKLSGVVSSSAQVQPLLPGGTVSASGQVLLNTVSGTTFSNTAFYFPLDVRVDGTLTAQQINTEYVSSSVIYESGSTKFGDTTDDVMSVTGSISVLGGRISGSMVGMFSSSAQVDYNSITNKLSGVVSSSVQVDYNSITNKLSGVVSSSAQFNALSGTTASFALTSAGGGGGGVAVTYITASNPVGNVNPATSGVLWLNASASELFTCADNTFNTNEWAGSTGTKLYYGRTESSSLTQPLLGIISGSRTNAVLSLIDRYGGTITQLITPTQSITFSSSSTGTVTLISSSGVYSGSGRYHTFLSTTNLSGSITLSASINNVTLRNNLLIPILTPRNIRGFGTNEYTLFSSLSSAAVTSGSGGVQFIDDRTNYWVSMSCGRGNCFFLDINGRLYSRGLNDYGQCGVGNTLTVTTLKEITGSSTYPGPWKNISAGTYHACGININNELYCWGNNSSGDLGLGDNTQRTVPVKVNSDTNWSTVSCGASSTLATKTNGTLWSWGLNNYSQLGLGDATNKNVPTQIGSSTDWSNGFTSNVTSHAIKTTGTLWGWGYNGNSTIGDGTTTQRTTPVQVGVATDWVSVTSPREGGNEYFKLGIRGTTLYGWGFNQLAQLTSQSIGATFSTPTQLTASVPPVKSVTCNTSQVFIIDTGSGLWGWTSTAMANNSQSVGTYLGYGTSVNAQFDNTASIGNQPPTGSVKRISSIYTHQQIAALQNTLGLMTITNIQTSSAGPANPPTAITASVINNLTACRIQWNNTDVNAETRVDIASASFTQSNWIRPGATQVYLRPTTATGSATTVRLSHIKNEVSSSIVSASSTLSFCPEAYSYEISNTCSGGQRTVVYPNGICGTITEGPYCDSSCPGYTYQGIYAKQAYESNLYDPCTGTNVYYEYQRFTNGACTVDEYYPCYGYWIPSQGGCGGNCGYTYSCTTGCNW